MARDVVLVTGGTGFIGSHLIRALVDGGRAVVSLDTAPLGDQARYILGSAGSSVVVDRVDIGDAEQVTAAFDKYRPTQVCHIASIANPVILRTNPALALRVNVGGTVNLLEAARAHGVGRFVYYSSIGVLPSVQYEPIDAQHPVVTSTEGPGSGFYGASKASAEVFAMAYHRCAGVDVRIIRPSAVYGLGMQWPIYLKPMVEGAVRGEPVRLATGGRFPRDYTHVDDVTGLTLAVLDGPDDADRVFYAATGEPLITGAQLATVVRGVIPGADIEIGDELSADDELEIRYRGRLSVENSRTQLGWNPRYAQIADGVAAYAKNYAEFLGSVSR